MSGNLQKTKCIQLIYVPSIIYVNQFYLQVQSSIMQMSQIRLKLRKKHTKNVTYFRPNIGGKFSFLFVTTIQCEWRVFKHNKVNIQVLLRLLSRKPLKNFVMLNKHTMIRPPVDWQFENVNKPARRSFPSLARPVISPLKLTGCYEG